MINKQKLFVAWSAGFRDAIATVNQLLLSSGTTMPEITAETMANNLEFIERMDRLITINGARQAAVLREIERHRAAF